MQRNQFTPPHTVPRPAFCLDTGPHGFFSWGGMGGGGPAPPPPPPGGAEFLEAPKKRFCLIQLLIGRRPEENLAQYFKGRGWVSGSKVVPHTHLTRRTPVVPSC